MKTLLQYIAIAMLTAIVFNTALVSIDKITKRDCDRGIKSACEALKTSNK